MQIFSIASALANQQKAISQYADTIEGQKWVSNEPSAKPPPQLSEPQIRYIQAAPTPQAAQARKAKVLRNPVVWQVTEQQLKALHWKRQQILQAHKAELDKKRKARALRGPPPKLGPSKASSVMSQASTAPKLGPSRNAASKQNAQKGTQPQPKVNPPQKPNGLPAKAPAKPQTKTPAKPQVQSRK